MYGHLNNSIYAFLFDSIINHYLIARCGVEPAPLENNNSNKHNQIGLVVSSYCDYFASVAYPDVLDLGLRVARLGSSSVTYEVGVFRQGEDAVRVVGGFTHVFVERDTMKPRGGMAEGIREGLEKLRVEAVPKL
jgi:acyl-CoA thioester hydrolase